MSGKRHLSEILLCDGTAARIPEHSSASKQMLGWWFDSVVLQALIFSVAATGVYAAGTLCGSSRLSAHAQAFLFCFIYSSPPLRHYVFELILLLRRCQMYVYVMVSAPALPSLLSSLSSFFYNQADSWRVASRNAFIVRVDWKISGAVQLAASRWTSYIEQDAKLYVCKRLNVNGNEMRK